MAEKKSVRGYTGLVPSAGAAAVQAPHQTAVRKNPLVHRGADLRGGKRKGGGA